MRPERKIHIFESLKELCRLRGQSFFARRSVHFPFSPKILAGIFFPHNLPSSDSFSISQYLQYISSSEYWYIFSGTSKHFSSFPVNLPNSRRSKNRKLTDGAYADTPSPSLYPGVRPVSISELLVLLPLPQLPQTLPSPRGTFITRGRNIGTRLSFHFGGSFSLIPYTTLSASFKHQIISLQPHNRPRVG